MKQIKKATAPLVLAFIEQHTLKGSTELIHANKYTKQIDKKGNSTFGVGFH
jgi:hypothetical protein